MTEKIELKTNHRLFSLMKYCGVVLVAFSIIKIAFINHLNFRELGEFVDSTIWLIGGSLLLYISQSKKIKDRRNQFIEWDDEKVIYKLVEEKDPIQIEFELITNASIQLTKLF